MIDKDMLYKEECYAIQGAVFSVYREMGCGFLEAVYQECLSIEFGLRGIPFTAQPEVRLMYKDRWLEKTYRPDFVCYGKIILEIKAVTVIAPEHRAQLLNYLKATQFELGLLANFGCYPRAVVQRMANTSNVRLVAGSRETDS